MTALETTDPVGMRPRYPRRGPWRLLVLIVFPISYITIESAIPPLGFAFQALTVLNAAACALLLWNLAGSLRRNLWIWVALILFLLGYFLKMAWFAHKLNDPAYINLYYSEVRWVNRDRILGGYPWVTLGFVTFCLVALVALRYTSENTGRHHSASPDRLSGPTKLIVIGTTLAYLLVMLLQISLHYGVLGLANPSLPYHLGGGITLFQRSLAPGILLLAIWIFDEQRSPWANITAVLVALLGISDGLITTSRGSLLLLTIPILVLWLLTGRFTRKRKLAGVILLATATLLYPFLSTLREEKLDPSGGPQATTLSVDSVLNSGFILISRLGAGGVDGVWYAMGASAPLSASRTLMFLEPNRLTLYYTQSVVRVPNANDFRPTGWIGGLMIVGGAGGVVVLGSLLLALLCAIWRRLQRQPIWPVSLSVGAGTFAIFVSGGTLDLLLLVKLGIQVWVCELIYRKLHHKTTRLGPISSRTSAVVGG